MAEIAIIPATEAHALELAPVVREADRIEIEAAAGISPLEALRISLTRSTEAWAGTVDDRVACMFGVGPLSLLGGEGCPWLIGGELVGQHAVAFLRRNKAMVVGWSKIFPVMRNAVDVRNTVAIRWLRWLGFTILPPVPYGVQRLPFHPFEMVAR